MISLFLKKHRCQLCPGLLIGLTLLCAFIACFVATVNHEPAVDDLKYMFVFDDANCTDPDSLEPVETYADVWRSQSWHYMNYNGRLPVHLLVQCFAGLWGLTAFALCNSLVYVIFLWLVMAVGCRRKLQMYDPWRWLLTLMVVQYLFPGAYNSLMGPWFGIAMGLNYLWPATMFLAVLYLVRKGGTGMIAAVTTGFLCGWSNEAFAVPLSGGLLCYWLMNHSRLSWTVKAMILALWVGTALLVFSPGSWARAGVQSEWGIVGLSVTMVECYLDIMLFWILILVMAGLLLLGRWFRIRRFVADNMLLFMILSVGVLFSVFAHTEGHSLCCIELISFILLLRLVTGTVGRGSVLSLSRWSGRVIYIFVLVTFGVHQSMVFNADCRAVAEYKAMGHRLVDSPDGVVWYDDQVVSPLVAPWADSYQGLYTPACDDWCVPYARYCGVRDKRPLQLTRSDYDALIVNPDSYFGSHMPLPGTARAYELDEYYVVRCADGMDDSTRFEARFDGADPVAGQGIVFRVLFKLFWQEKKPMVLNAARCVNTRSGGYILIPKSSFVPSSINIVS